MTPDITAMKRIIISYCGTGAGAGGIEWDVWGGISDDKVRKIYGEYTLFVYGAVMAVEDGS